MILRFFSRPALSANCIAVGLAALLFVAGCTPFKARPDEARYFTLRPVEETSLHADAPSVRLDEVRVPAFLDRRRIAVRLDSTEIDYSIDNLWSETFRDEAQEALRMHLRLLGVDAGDRSDPNLGRLAVFIDRFDATEAGTIRLEASWRWVPAPGEPPVRRRFEGDGSWSGDDYASLATGKSALLRRLAEAIAGTIREPA